MLEFLSQNIGTIAVGIPLLGILALIVRSLLNDKKKGKSSCGSACSGCPNSHMCHKG